MSKDYGDGTYGDGYYGSGTHADVDPIWVDITPEVFGITITRGSRDGGMAVPVSEARVDWVDQSGELFPFTPELNIQRPGPGTFMRISIVDPSGDFTPLFVGRMSEVMNQHDESGVRLAAVQAWGVESDLSTTIPWTRSNNEWTSTRLAAALDAADWAWAEYPYTADPDLDWPDDPTPQHRDVDSPQANALQVIDQVAQSCGWVADFAADGTPRVRRFPLESDGTFPIIAVDAEDDDGYATPRVVYRHDFAETLNRVSMLTPATVDNASEVTTTREDTTSIGTIGPHTQALGFPLSNLTSATQDYLEAMGDRILARYSDANVRVAELDADSALDPRWLERLPELDRGTPVLVARTGLAEYPLEVLGYVTGYTHVITPDRWQATLATTTDIVAETIDLET